MKVEEVFEEFIGKVQDKKKLVQCFVGTVAELDKEEGTATVEREDKPTLYKVRLNAITGSLTDKIEVFPVVGSEVLCNLVDNNKTEAAILKYSEIESILATIGGNSFILDKDGVAFNEGKNGGLGIVEKINENLEAIKTYVEAIHSALPGAFNAVGLGPAASGTAGATAYTGTMATQKPIILKDIENPKVKH